MKKQKVQLTVYKYVKLDQGPMLTEFGKLLEVLSALGLTSPGALLDPYPGMEWQAQASS